MSWHKGSKPSREEIAQRRAAAVEMRRAGASPEQIAQRLAYADANAARRDINLVLSDVMRVPTEEAKALELLRIDGLLMTYWPEAKRGVTSAANQVIKLIELRAKLVGLYAPVQVEQVTMDAIESEIQRLERELGPAAKRAVRQSRTKGAPGVSSQKADGDTAAA